ncbi:AfsR/SARP family transcriptional regulator [Streptomyces lushanensis]|uniref:AfsR/SARP family transcriptional regulator n=1 Tax=Streptomyces lushanensis TaxID=1434255 RepID=UPI00082BC34B|nr:AfsR/SARP family transcriptional regulator [Streptomyces lushanensis]
MEVQTDSGPVELGGTRQRAALGFLLLHANRVVPTSQLLDALWPTDRAPMTARKILQNAVWRLRRALAHAAGSEDAPELVTRSPGYMLRVRPGQIDLLVFQQRVAEGRAALAAGDPRTASRVLRDALSLWQGVALADLVEDGTAWPQLTAVQEKRLDVMEDRFEAELACGGHHAVLRELEAFVEAEPLRERASQQLMIALYRCGRQAEALGVYNRVRAALVGGLGLEPGRQMQRLQQSVLTQDPSLDLPAEVTARREHAFAVTAPLPPAEAGQAPEEDDGAHAAEDVTGPDLAPAEASGDTDAGDARNTGITGTTRNTGETRNPGTAGSTGDTGNAGIPENTEEPLNSRQPATILMLRFQLGTEFDHLPPKDVDRVLDAVSQLAREKIEEFGGLAAASIGSVQLGYFAHSPEQACGADRAVRVGIAVRDCLSVPSGPLAPPAPMVRGLDVHAAVTTGEAVVTRWPVAGAVRPWIGGDLVDSCQDMLDRTPAGEVRVCDETRRLTEPLVTYHHVRKSPSNWQVRAVGGVTDGTDELCVAHPGERECELDLMHGLLRRTQHRSLPHLITVLGESGFGKTRLLMEFQRRLAAERDDVRVLAGTVPRPGTGSPLAVPSEMFAMYCGITDQDPEGAALHKAEAALLRLTGRADDARVLLSLLHPLIAAVPHSHRAPFTDEVLAAWRDFLVKAAREQLLVLIWDDLHHADDILLETVEHLTERCADAPLLNVVGARALLLERRPDWAGGRQHTMTISLAPVDGDALDRLLKSLLVPDGSADVA